MIPRPGILRLQCPMLEDERKFFASPVDKHAKAPLAGVFEDAFERSTTPFHDAASCHLPISLKY
jgi:hypothetical protein